MLILIKSQANQIGVTVRELQTLPVVNYLFEFYNIEQDKNYLVYLSIENDSNRIDLFTITLPGDLDLPSGEFLYKIYQSENLVLSTDGKLLLEQGRAKIEKDFPAGNYFTFNTENTVNYVE